MELDGSALDRAYAVFEEWGPKKRTPRQARLAETFPELSELEIESTLEKLRAVTETVWVIAKLGAQPKLGKDKVTALLQDRHPFLKNEGLRRALFLTNYYAWHEGYAQP
jgi:hypothetical protein